MELKDNMYIMSNDRLQIGIVKFIENNIPVIALNGKVQWLEFCGIFWNRKSATFNLIDLIKIGDYVNGYKVTAIYNPNGDEMYHITILTEKGYELIHYDKEIKSIVTKEQFASMEYKV